MSVLKDVDYVSDHTWFIHQIHQTLSLVTIKFRHSKRMLAKYLKRQDFSRKLDEKARFARVRAARGWSPAQG